MFKVGITVLIIISLIALGSLTVTMMGIFGLSGHVWDSIRNYLDWGWLEKYQAFVVGSIAACLLLWAAVVAMFQLRAARRTSYADLLARLAQEWNSDPFIESRKRLLQLAPLEMGQEEQRHVVRERMEAVQRDGHEDYFLLTRPLDFFESLALLIRKDYIPLEDVRRSFGEPMVAYYTLFEDCVIEMRKVLGNKDAYIELEEVVRRLAKYIPTT